MKRFQFLAGFLCGMVVFSGGAAYAAGVMAEHLPQQVYVDGQAVQMDAYNVADTNYMKLRDIGQAVGFNVYWDGTAIQIESGSPYTGQAPAQQPSVSDAASPDKAAVALFELILKDNAAPVVEVFGYPSEAAARKDMGLENSIYGEIADEVVAQFSDMGYDVPQKDVEGFVDAFLSMFKEVKMTARVKSLDENAGTAVVTCTVSTFDTNAMELIMLEAVNEIDPALIEQGGEDAMFRALLNAMTKGIAGLKPSGRTADFDVSFKREELIVNGKVKAVWVPEDAEEFGNLISATAMGG